MIIIRSPRYRDRTVLLARYKLTPYSDATIKITEGAYKGIYKASGEAIMKSATEKMKTRSGQSLEMKAVPLDSLERIGDL